MQILSFNFRSQKLFLLVPSPPAMCGRFSSTLKVFKVLIDSHSQSESVAMSKISQIYLNFHQSDTHIHTHTHTLSLTFLVFMMYLIINEGKSNIFYQKTETECCSIYGSSIWICQRNRWGT